MERLPSEKYIHRVPLTHENVSQCQKIKVLLNYTTKRNFQELKHVIRSKFVKPYLRRYDLRSAV